VNSETKQGPGTLQNDNILICRSAVGIAEFTDLENVFPKKAMYIICQGLEMAMAVETGRLIGLAIVVVTTTTKTQL
jgi:hypothetical protein